MKEITTILFALFLSTSVFSQTTFDIRVNASEQMGKIAPLWNDYWELNVQHGYGLNPFWFPNSPHTPFIQDTGFLPSMAFLQPRSIKASVAAFIALPHLDYASSDTAVLKVLPTEFYRGGNSLAEADQPGNYYFGYLDSLLNALEAIGVEVFLNFDYMPFTLASNKIPHYYASPLINSAWQYDNEIRTVPPANNAVYARVVRNTVRHVRGLFKGNKNYGIRYIEIWNEPDHQTLTNLLPNFWGGDAHQLYEMYRAIVQEIENDAPLKDVIKIGCCSFAMANASEIQFADNFLLEISNNNTRLDFLSVHPYSADAFRSLDTSKLTLAQNRIDGYAPGAELVNAEWGILNANSLSFTETLEHDLINFKDVQLMLDRQVKFAHYVGLVEFGVSNAQPNLGVCRSNPIAPKITAVARANMNKLLETPNRLQAMSPNGGVAIAGINEEASKIVVAIPAVKPDSGQTNTVNLVVENIPWSTTYSATIFELSESDYDNSDYFKIINHSAGLQGDYAISLSYNRDQNSGRLYTLVLEKDISAVSLPAGKAAQLQIYPNPAVERVVFDVENWPGGLLHFALMDAQGRMVRQLNSTSLPLTLERGQLPAGVYFFRMADLSGDMVWSGKVLIR